MRRRASILTSRLFYLLQLDKVNPFVSTLLAANLLLLQPALSNATGNGAAVIELDRQSQTLAGIQTTELKPTHFQSESIAYGQAVNLQPLLDLRIRYFNTVAERDKAKANLDEAEQALARIRHLHTNQAASTRQFQQQRSLWQSAKAEYEGSRYRVKAAQESILLGWGNQIANWVFIPDSKPFSQLITGEKTLLRITLPPNQNLPAGVDFVYFAASGRRGAADKATLLSSAPHTDTVLQGATYFFLTQQKIRSGMHVSVWIPQQQTPLTGVNIPASAIVRYLGQQYVYLQTGATQFIRRRLPHLIDTGNGYFSQSELVPGDRLVTTGAQLLLSEEFRRRIPDEDDDD